LLDRALTQLKADLERARIAAEASHAAQDELRRKREAEQRADHEAQMNIRKADFLSQYPNVWASGHSGLYLAHATLSGAVPGDYFVKRVTDNAYASDCLLSKDTSARHFRNQNTNEAGYLRYKVYCVVG